METIKVALGKALQIKKRLVGRLARVEADIYQYNSTLAEQSGTTVDVRKQLEMRTAIKEAILEVKSALYKANNDIQSKLTEFSEKKGDIDFYKAINTTDGKLRHGYQNTEIVYTAVVKKEEADAAIKRLESEMDTLQDEINVFNYSTKVELPKSVLNLAS